MQKIFIGIPFPPDIAAAAESWQEARRASFHARWTLPEDLHVTIIPPWQEKDPAAAADKLAFIGGYFPAFPLEFEWISMGPSPSRPRFIWAHGTAPVELLDLKKDIEDALGIPPEDRDIFLHATLARFSSEEAGLLSPGEKLLEEPISWKMQADRFTVFESIPNANGAKYRVLHEIRLA